MTKSSRSSDIIAAIEDLAEHFGVREDLKCRCALELAEKGELRACVQEIAALLGLPIRMEVSFIIRNRSGSVSGAFDSDALARTESPRRGVEGIAAQVSIPHDLPLLGSPELQGYPIQIKLGDNCDASPESFVALVAHELSHIILVAARHPQKESELYTDLLPVILGFRMPILNGRRVSKSETERTLKGSTTTTSLTTFGYLSDEQFYEAFNYVGKVAVRHQKEKKSLMERVNQTNNILKQLQLDYRVVTVYLSRLSKELPTNLDIEESRKIGQLFGEDGISKWKTVMREGALQIVQVKSFVEKLTHYTRGNSDRLRTYSQSVDLTSKDLKNASSEIARAKRLLGRHIGISFKLSTAIRIFLGSAEERLEEI